MSNAQYCIEMVLHRHGRDHGGRGSRHLVGPRSVAPNSAWPRRGAWSKSAPTSPHWPRTLQVLTPPRHRERLSVAATTAPPTRIAGLSQCRAAKAPFLTGDEHHATQKGVPQLALTRRRSR